MKRIILASASPRRRALLTQIGLPFTAVASGYREDINAHADPRALVAVLSRGKARAVASHHPHAVVIAADTVVVAGRRILGKPRSRTEASAQLRALNGKTHAVMTGFTVVDARAKKEVTRVVTTTVEFRKLTARDLQRYVESGRWRGFAGSYAIQKYGGIFVRKIEGDYFNVVGLPLCALAQELKKFGVYL